MSDTNHPDTGHPDMSDNAQTPDMDLDATLTLQAAAVRAGVHERTARRWITSGQLHAVNLGGQYRITVADLTAAMEEQPGTARASDTDTGQGNPGTGHEDRPATGRVSPDTGHPVPIDLAPLADLIERQGRQLAEANPAAAMWQAQAAHLDEQMKQLTATVGTATGVESGEAGDQGGSPEPNATGRPAGMWHHWGPPIMGAILGSAIIADIAAGVDWGSVYEVGGLAIGFVAAIVFFPAYLRVTARKERSGGEGTRLFPYATDRERWLITAGAGMIAASSFLIATDLPGA